MLTHNPKSNFPLESNSTKFTVFPSIASRGSNSYNCSFFPSRCHLRFPTVPILHSQVPGLEVCIEPPRTRQCGCYLRAAEIFWVPGVGGGVAFSSVMKETWETLLNKLYVNLRTSELPSPQRESFYSLRKIGSNKSLYNLRYRFLVLNINLLT